MTNPKIQASIILSVLFLSGCATYSVQKGESPYNKGYVVTRYGRVLPEYTLGKDNSVPDEQVARERFQRRKKEVEAYYKKMGYIENRFKQTFVDPPVFMLQAVAGILRMPAIAIRDYKYNHDPKYKEKIDQQEDAEYKAEKERIKTLKDYGDKVGQAERADIEAKSNDLKTAIKDKNVDRIKKGMEELTKVSHKLAEEIYKAAHNNFYNSICAVSF